MVLDPHIKRKKRGTQGENSIMIERRKLLKISASGLAASVAMPFIGRTGWAATPTHTLKLTFADTQNHPLYEVLKRFSEDVSNDEIAAKFRLLCEPVVSSERCRRIEETVLGLEQSADIGTLLALLSEEVRPIFGTNAE